MIKVKINNVKASPLLRDFGLLKDSLVGTSTPTLRYQANHTKHTAPWIKILSENSKLLRKQWCSKTEVIRFTYAFYVHLIKPWCENKLAGWTPWLYTGVNSDHLSLTRTWALDCMEARRMQFSLGLKGKGAEYYSQIKSSVHFRLIILMGNKRILSRSENIQKSEQTKSLQIPFT